MKKKMKDKRITKSIIGIIYFIHLSKKCTNIQCIKCTNVYSLCIISDIDTNGFSKTTIYIDSLKIKIVYCKSCQLPKWTN